MVNGIFLVKMRLNEKFLESNKYGLGKELFSFRISPIVLFTSLSLVFRCFLKLS